MVDAAQEADANWVETSHELACVCFFGMEIMGSKS